MDTPRSELHGKILTFIGFTFLKHPLRKNFFVQISIYKEKDKECLIICTSEGRGKGSIKQAFNGLGGEVQGRFIAPFAQRKLEGEKINLEELKKALMSDNPNAKWHWHDNKTNV